MIYDNIKSHKKPAFHPLFRRYIFLGLNKIVENENSPDNYKTLKVSVEAIIKNLEMLIFFLIHLRLKPCIKNAVKKLSFVIMYVPNRFKTQVMCDKVIQKMVKC